MGRAADRSPAVVDVAAACYRGVLRLYPQPFWRSYHDELEGDFEEASGEALDAGGWRGLLACWTDIACDLPLSMAREWLRTPWIPALALGAAAATLAVAASIGRLYAPLRAYRDMVAPRIETPKDSPELTMLLLVMGLIPVVAVILVYGAAIMGHFRSTRPSRRV